MELYASPITVREYVTVKANLLAKLDRCMKMCLANTYTRTHMKIMELKGSRICHPKI